MGRLVFAILVLTASAVAAARFALTGRMPSAGRRCFYGLLQFIQRWHDGGNLPARARSSRAESAPEYKSLFAAHCRRLTISAGLLKRRALGTVHRLKQLTRRYLPAALADRPRRAALSIASILAALAPRLRPHNLLHRLLPGPPTPHLHCPTQPDPPPDLNLFNCRLRPTPAPENGPPDALVVEICGSIRSPSENRQVSLNLTISDATDSPRSPRPVRARAATSQADDTSTFSYTTDLGQLTSRNTVLSDWTAVAKIPLNTILFPRKGNRILKCHAQIVERARREVLACTEFTVAYHNNNLGYIDLEENIRQTRTLAVALAFAVSAADGKIYRPQVELIKDWARRNIGSPNASDNARRALEKALDKTLTFFLQANRLDTDKICARIATIAPLAERYQALDLFLRVARTKASVTQKELALLNDFAHKLGIEPDVFRQMMEKTLPVGIHQVKDSKLVLGLTPDMDSQQARDILTRAYSKWNARVTNSDPEIQAQADQMLSLIAEARRQYLD